MDRITSFPFRGENVQVFYVDTKEVFPGVTCDEYVFAGDDLKDLGIIEIQPGSKTPWQRVLSGTCTIEGYRSGKGTLSIIKPDGTRKEYNFSGVHQSFSVVVEVGDVMQWAADTESVLVAYEVCEPPYRDGRFLELTEEEI